MSSPDDQTLLGGEAAIGSRFLFEVDTVAIGLFQSVRGLAVSAEIVRDAQPRTDVGLRVGLQVSTDVNAANGRAVSRDDEFAGRRVEV